MTAKDLEQQTRDDLSAVFDTKHGRRVIDHLQRVFGDSPTKPAPISGDQMRGRNEVIFYIIKNAELINSRSVRESADTTND